MAKKEKFKNFLETFKQGLITGFGWSIGATIGFAVISTLLIVVLQSLGGLPLIGDWIASVVEVTQSSLVERTPILPEKQ